MRTKILATLALAIALPAVLAAGASGEALGNAGGLKYVHAGATLASGSLDPTSAKAYANCGKGWYPTGGGAQVAGDGSWLSSSAWADTHRWFATAAHHDEGARRMFAYAVCTRSTRYSPTTVVKDLGGSGRASQEASCKNGSHISGGGAALVGDDPEYWTLYSASPSGSAGTSWSASGYFSSSIPVTLVTSIVCVKGPSPVRHTAARRARPDAPTTLRSSCGRRHVLGGGVRIAPSASGHVSFSRPFDGRDKDSTPDDGWLVRVKPDSGRPILKAYAICTR